MNKQWGRQKCDIPQYGDQAAGRRNPFKRARRMETKRDRRRLEEEGAAGRRLEWKHGDQHAAQEEDGPPPPREGPMEMRAMPGASAGRNDAGAPL